MIQSAFFLHTNIFVGISDKKGFQLPPCRSLFVRWNPMYLLVYWDGLRQTLDKYGRGRSALGKPSLTLRRGAMRLHGATPHGV